MANKFVCADPHFSHKGVCTFLAPNGIDKLRPWDNPDEMDEALVENWNSVVRPEDSVDILGDVCINRRGLQVVKRLNGKKRLVKGNHDVFRIGEYLEHFYDVVACVTRKDMIMTHIPLHPSQLNRFGVNVHGHLHAHTIDDPRYICVSMEHTDFRPISLDELRQRIEFRKEAYLNIAETTT